MKTKTIEIKGWITECKFGPQDEATYGFSTSDYRSEFTQPIMAHTLVVNVPDTNHDAGRVAAIEDKIQKLQADTYQKVTGLREMQQSWLALPNEAKPSDQAFNDLPF